MESQSRFNAQIAANRAAERATADTVAITHEGSTLAVRLRGGFITECSVRNPNTSEPLALLYCEPNLSIPKLMATHTMAPAGPFEGPGGQHGFARWADYIVTDQGESALTLEAKRDDGEILLTKRFGIAAKEFTSETILRNPDAEMLRTSLGEHYYYPLAGEDTSGLTIDGVSIDELLGEGTLEQIMSGEAAFWRDFPGLADIHFPAGYTLRLEASTEPNAQLGVLLWHKPDTETICFEPTAGYIHTKMNSGLGLEQGESASLTSSLTLI